MVMTHGKWSIVWWKNNYQYLCTQDHRQHIRRRRFVQQSIMSYTGHLCATSLVHYDSTNLAKAEKATNILLLSEDLPNGPPLTDPVDFSHSNATRYSI